MTKYAKIKDNSLEYAPRNKGSISNWINDEEAVLAEGYLPYEPTEHPTDGKRYNVTYEEQDGKIVTVYIENPYTYEEVQQTRANLYAQEVDPLMAEYTRKKTFNLFEEGEEAELLARIEAVVAWIKESNPYPEVEVITPNDSENNELEEENAVEVIILENENDQVSEQVTEQVND